MSTLTSRLRLYKPAADGSENVNVVSDLNDNWDRLDSLVSFVPVTSVTYPASSYQGQAFFETDTGEAYVNKSAVPSASDLWQILTAGSVFHYPLAIEGDGNFSIQASSGEINVAASTTGSGVLSGKVSGDAFNRFVLFGSGTMEFGSGSGARDVSVYRDSAGVLGIDESLITTGDVIVGDTLYADFAEITNNVLIGSARIKPQLHVATTVSNTTSESALQTFNIAANDAVVGAVYRIRAYGTAQVTGTPTMTFRFRIGGTGGTSLLAFSAITARSNMTDGFWEIELIATCSATGVSGTWSPFGRGGHNFVGTAATLTSLLTAVTASVTRDTTISNDLVLTGQWSAASSSNSIVCRGALIERIA